MTSIAKLRPLLNRVLITRAAKKEVSAGGIIIPEKVRRSTHRAQLLSARVPPSYQLNTLSGPFCETIC